MKNKLQITLNALNNLDTDRTCLVSYFEPTRELIIRQHGSNIVRLNHLVGYIVPVKHTCILYPEDLRYLKEIITYILKSVDHLLISPVKGGYKAWEIGDTSYTSRPRFLGYIRFYSVTNRFLILVERIKSEEIRLLYRTIAKANR